MLYNYYHTWLKLSHKLNMDSAINFVPTLSIALLAVAFASLAPILVSIFNQTVASFEIRQLTVGFDGQENRNLLIIPMTLATSNLLIYWLARKLNKLLRQSLCPMLFADSN